MVALVLLAAGALAFRRQARRLKRAEHRLQLVAPQLQSASGGLGRNIGLVRFNPYGDTGGDYSFALALLDPGGDGVVLTCLYHREGCRVYAKPVSEWKSPQVLSEEEVEALERARGERGSGRGEG